MAVTSHFIQFTLCDPLPEETISVRADRIVSIRELKSQSYPRTVITTDQDIWHVKASIEEVTALIEESMKEQDTL